MEKLIINKPIICEGKYDKIKLSSILDAHIITTEGFGIFREHEKLALIRRLAAGRGVIVFTDSDGAGLVIRNFFNSALPKDQVTHLYIPEIPGKERRKKAHSKAGLLGVEGVEAEILRNIFRPFAETPENTEADKTVSGEKSSGNTRKSEREVTKTDFYSDRLSGGEGSEERRKKLAAFLSLPTNMSSNALLAAINLLYSYDEYSEAIKRIFMSDSDV